MKGNITEQCFVIVAVVVVVVVVYSWIYCWFQRF